MIRTGGRVRFLRDRRFEWEPKRLESSHMPIPIISSNREGPGMSHAGRNPLCASKDEKPLVWALIPYRIEGSRLTAETFENEPTKSELAAAFYELGIPWIWQPTVLSSMEEITAQLTVSMQHRPTVVFNFCDGLDRDGTPGVSVVKALEGAGIPFTGSDSRFYGISTCKLHMKKLFRERGVETAPWEVLPRTGPVRGVCQRLGIPLLVKPDVSYASYGISLKSKVCTDAEIGARRDELRQGEMGRTFADEEIFAERYLAGHEYTVFVGGYWDQPDQLWTLPPAHRRFADSIPPEERFLTYDRYWAYYNEESMPARGEPFYSYELVQGELCEELVGLALRAYCAVKGHGYARVDIRRDTVNGNLSVLEVNANCGLSGDDQTSTGSILRLMGWNYSDLLLRILGQTLQRRAV
jgi:D-alanine-D-alanine ligase